MLRVIKNIVNTENLLIMSLPDDIFSAYTKGFSYYKVHITISSGVRIRSIILYGENNYISHLDAPADIGGSVRGCGFVMGTTYVPVTETSFSGITPKYYQMWNEPPYVNGYDFFDCYTMGNYYNPQEFIYYDPVPFKLTTLVLTRSYYGGSAITGMSVLASNDNTTWETLVDLDAGYNDDVVTIEF